MFSLKLWTESHVGFNNNCFTSVKNTSSRVVFHCSIPLLAMQTKPLLIASHDCLVFPQNKEVDGKLANIVLSFDNRMPITYEGHR